jgi:hypothetical protein
MVTLVELAQGWALFDEYGHYLGSFRVYGFEAVCADVARFIAEGSR